MRCCLLVIMLGLGVYVSPLRPSIRHTIAFGIRPILSTGFAHRHVIRHQRPGYVTRPSSTIRNKCTAQWAKFEIGDQVLIDWDEESNASFKSGTIEEIKGGGWYTLCLDDSIRVKRRGSQLQKKVVDLQDQKETSETEVMLPNVEIMSLDSMLQHVHHDNLQSESKSHLRLDQETLEQLQSCHTKCNRWLIFSDLHVMPSTLSTCLRVLDFVHTTAVDRDAGILFLGDFWHHRGFVRVDCLNAVLELMSKWTVPSIMIPGNHDQVNWAGTEHALTPLKNAYRVSCENTERQYPGPLILSHPTVLMNALFVPHTRDKSVMKAILTSEEAANSCALFVHADVKGASMNDLIKSQHGISADSFPSNKCVYSGHFHKPHVVNIKGSQIRYVGSPYQTSLNEAGQSKALLLVDANKDWKCIEEITIDVGPRYHRISSVSKFLQVDNDNSLRPGDKVSLAVPQNELDEMRLLSVSESSLFDAKMKELRCRNVTVEIRNVQTEPIESTSAIQKTESDGQLELEELSPKATLDAYIRAEVSSGGLSSAAAESRLNIGHAVLSELCDDSSQHDAVDYSRRKNPVAIELDSVSIAGFGSFRKEVHYPLNKRGIVLLRGTNKDFGSDSNGVGKSTLAMASLWALIGSLDSRPVQDGRVVDIVNDLSKMAEVTLRGSLDSKAFVIKRTKNMSSGSSLSFALDGTDLTLQAASDTQKLINEKFAEEPQLLMRSIFHGQHSIGTLLESSDAKLKEELSSLISLDVWQKSASLVRSKYRDMQRKVSEIDGMLSIRRRDVERASEKRASAEHELNRRKTAVDEERALLSEQETALTALESSHLEDAITNLQTELRKSNDAIAALEHELYDMTAVDNTRIASLRSQLEEAVLTEQLLLNDLQRSANNYDAKKAQLVSLENQINTTRSDWNFGASKTVAAARSICKTCGQPISSEETVEFLRRSAMNKIDALISQIQSVSQEVATAELSKINAAEAVSTISKDVHAYRINLQREEASLASRSQDLRDKLKAERLSQSNKSTEYARLIKQSQQISHSKLSLSDLQSKLHRLNDALKAANDTYKACCADLDSIQQPITDMERDKETMTKEASSYASLADIFGTKGIQTFVLRNIVKALEYYSQSYLDELSDGSLQLVFEVGQNDNIVKQAKVLNGDGCTWRTRSLSSLSGGQWRRCSLALSLGFVDLASHRGKLRSNLLVLDEPLTHLDSSGRDSVGKLLRKMLGNSNDGGGQVLGGIGLSTILVILQDIAAEEIEEYFDYIDEVVKCDGESYVVLDQAFNR